MRLTQDNYACGIFVDLKKAFDTKWHRGVVVINTPQLHSTKPKPRFYAGSKPARGVSEIWDDEDLCQWFRLEKWLNAFRLSTIPQKQFIIFIIINSIKFFKKLVYYNVGGIPNKCFASYLSDRKQFVSLCGYRSNIADVSCWVPESFILGPLLFLIYIND